MTSSKNRQIFLRYLLPLGLTALLVGLDQYTKIAIFGNWLKGHEEHIFVEGFFSFRAVENRGIVFGLFQGGGKWLLILGAIAMGFLIYWAVQFWYSAFFRIAATLIMSGALGNLIDRVTLGFVRDFIHFDFWYTFNVADAYISVGTVLFMGLIIFTKEPEKSGADQAKDTQTQNVP